MRPPFPLQRSTGLIACWETKIPHADRMAKKKERNSAKCISCLDPIVCSILVCSFLCTASCSQFLHTISQITAFKKTFWRMRWNAFQTYNAFLSLSQVNCLNIKYLESHFFHKLYRGDCLW